MPEESSGLVGLQVAGYQVLEKLGSGGMGVVYKAVDVKLNRPVALKFLSWEAGRGESEKERFLREARAASNLDHANVGTVHAIEETESGQPFIVMAYYDGETLSQRIRRGALPWRQAAEMALQIAGGLAEAHAKNVVHRDIKPSNILITRDGVAKIIDFGVAKLADSGALTRTGAAIGTVGYMSPEQASGAPVDHRSDLWSLGVVLYEMMTGRLPFAGDSAPATLYAIVHQPPAPSAALNPEIEPIVLRLLAKDPAHRYQSARELIGALQAVRPSGTTVTRTLSPAESGELRQRTREPTVEPTARRRYALWAAGVLALLLAVAAAFWHRLVPGSPPVKHVAVLPFQNLGRDPAGAALCDGLMEVITSRLTDLAAGGRGLWVLPAGEVRRRKIDNPSEARRQLGATWVVTGSVQPSSERGVRLIVNLVDAKDLRQIGSAVLDETSGDFAKLQDETLERLRQFLNLERAPSQTRAGESSNAPAAYESYLKGVGYLGRYDITANLDRSIEAFEAATRSDPRFALAYAGLGQAYWRKYRLDMNTAWLKPALENCRRAAEINDQLAPVHAMLGRIHDGTGQHELALQEFHRALELDRHNADTYAGMGRSYQSMGRPAEAEAAYRQAVALAPEDWNSHNSLGAFYYTQRRYADAAREFRRVVELTPDNARAWGNLGGALLGQEKTAEARQAFQKSLSIDPTYGTYTSLGTLDLNAGYNDEAVSLYENALALNDHDYRVWGGLGDACQRSNAPAEKTRSAFARAAQMAAEALRANPGDVGATWELAYYSAKLRRRDEALRRIRNALALAPDDPDVLEAAAVIYEIFGMRTRAVQYARNALERGVARSSFELDPDLRGLVRDSGLTSTVRR